MSTRDQILEVEQVIFESGDPEVNVRGTIKQGFLSYETEIIINSTQLNAIMNQLQRNNPDTNIYDLLESIELDVNTTLFRGVFQSLTHKNIDLMFIQDIESIKEIRA